jgi:hypothetical protein
VPAPSGALPCPGTGPDAGAPSTTPSAGRGVLLAYCEAGFRVGYLGVSQLGLARKPFSAG